MKIIIFWIIVVAFYVWRRYKHRCLKCGSWRRRILRLETVSHRNSSGGIITHGGYQKQVYCRRCDAPLWKYDQSCPNLYQRY